MNDGELLVLAAKAAGMPPPVDTNGVWSAWVDTVENGHWWNPLEDDGDAFRLAVDLCLFNGSMMFHFGLLERLENPEATELEWTRRAIVRAAADIGKAMP